MVTSNSLIIPSPNLPLVTIRSFSKSVSPFLVCKLVYLYNLFLDSAYKGYYIFLFLSDLFHSIWQSLGPFMLQQLTLFHSSWWLSNIPLRCFPGSSYGKESACNARDLRYVPLFLYSFSVNERLGCFHVLAISKSTAMNIGVCESFWIIFFSGYMPRNQAIGSQTHM